MYRVLIADDEEIERLSFSRKLKKYFGESCEVFHAENGMQAILAVDKNDTPIVIMDIGMPGMNGVEAAEWIRKSHPDCVIIFLTAYDDFSYAKRAVSLHALEYLLKPCDDEELIPVMEEAMRLTDEHLADAAALSGRGQAAGMGAGETAAAQEPREEMEEDGNIRLSKVAELISQYIRENYMYDISMQELARTMNYSEPYFCKLFKQCFNKNFTSYLTEYRVEEAKKMLEQPTVNVKEIGKAVGYGDSNYFAKVFKRITGQSPTEYRLYIFQRG